MEVEIWSDVMCPFCYIGKRRFENALANFEYNNEIDVTWRSFQLNPDMETDPDANINEYLAEAKGWSLEQAQQMNQRVTDMAADEGLEYNMDQAVVANSYDAHRLVQFAKDRGKGDEMEEALFKAYFTDGKNIADHQTLIALAESIGIDPTEAKSILESEKYANAVNHDIQLAQNINITGVPFFLFDRKFAVSGARETEVFLKALKQSWNAKVEGQQKSK
ncbi:DsbA family oxidoreductase [Fodinibius sp.]|uniref:DsbA family oxidoreductase n=1 Tax=Fodinibius sp. TaxID=1872440 RepID=UPI002ACEF203|nr:DsbA family oxidoreductase [Fodinibius sp.]MDZ7659131.1 DsbA family oxidoreductase [Fodinibius sp.]